MAPWRTCTLTLMLSRLVGAGAPAGHGDRAADLSHTGRSRRRAVRPDACRRRG